MLTSSQDAIVQTWIQAMHDLDRVPTQIPPTAPIAIADPGLVGLLGSRLAQPSPVLGPGPAQWDYQVAPDPLPQLWAQEAQGPDTSLGAAIVTYSQSTLTTANQINSFLADLPQLTGQAIGTAAHLVGEGIWSAVGAALGFSPWWIIGPAIGLGVYVLVSDRGAARASTAVSRARRIGTAFL